MYLSKAYWMALICLTLLVLPAYGGQYAFTPIFSASIGTEIIPGGINASGTAAFSLPEIGVFSGNGGPLTQIA